MAKITQTRPVPFPLVTALAAGGVMLWAWLGSDDQPEGCYRIDAGTHLAIAYGKVRLIGKHPAEARILAADRARGWVLDLDRELVYDPAFRADAQFEQGAPASRAKSLVIDERFGEAPGIIFHPRPGVDVRFPEVACDTVPKAGPTGA